MNSYVGCLVWPNAQGKRRRSTEGAQGTNKGQDNGEALALVGVRLTAQLGLRPGALWMATHRPTWDLACA